MKAPDAWELTPHTLDCARCGYRWIARCHWPRVCARCKSPYWDRPCIVPQRRPKMFGAARPHTDIDTDTDILIAILKGEG